METSNPAIPANETIINEESERNGNDVPVTTYGGTRTESRRICPLPTISIEESPPILVSSLQIIDSSRVIRTDRTVNKVKSACVNEYGNTETEERHSTDFRDEESESEGLRKHDTTRNNESVEDNSEKLSEIEIQPDSRREFRSLGPSLRRKGRRNTNFRKAISEEAKLNEIQAEDLEKRLKALAAAFSERTERVKKKIEQPPTPSSAESDSDEPKPGEPTLLDRLRQLASPAPSEFGETRRKSISQKIKGRFLKNLSYVYDVILCNFILDPQSSIYIAWLIVVASAFLYNAYVIPLRIVFPYQTKKNELIWVIFDSIADIIYLIDMIAFKPHVKYIQNGFWIKEPKETMKTYLGTIQFKIDVLSLLPADIAVNVFYRNMPILRLPRVLKVETFWELFHQLDTYLANPHRARIFHTCLYMLYMIHMVACSYYAVSTWEGIGTTTWTFDGHGNAYIRCFYFATKTATSIGKNPKPENELEYVFMTFAWLSGVFVTAILIGQIRDIIATATKSQTEYRILTSATISYLHRLGVPRRLEDRVKLWLSYTWEQQKTLDETKILDLLPKNMKAEIALNIHVETLAKVKLFQNCETAFLRDLVVKLRSIIILPGDFVCRKGEIGREMFIVKSGRIHVIGGPNGTQILATLAEGSVFGEIALLGIGGMTKRTADVKTAGFVNLFVLNKADLNDVIRDYPEAQEIMQRKAKKLMRENIKKARATPSPAAASEDATTFVEESGVIIKNKSEPPQLIATMLKLFPPTTKIGRYLTKGSKISSTTASIANSLENMNKPEEHNIYTSLTSYPPSPFIPSSPGHISPELDISIMTGDSSDKRLSLPIEDNVSELSGLLSSDDTSFPSYPEFTSAKLERTRNWETVRKSPSTSSSASSNKGKGGSVGTTLDFKDNRLARCRSPLPPFLRTEDDTDLPGEEKVKGTSSHSESSNRTEARDDIPIQIRPPLYIIEPDIYGLDDESKRTPSKEKIWRRALLIDSSIESEDKAEDEIDTEAPFQPSQNAASRGDDENETRSASKASASSSATARIASRFISRIRGRGRGTLERQIEVDVEVDAEDEAEEEQRNMKVDKKEEFILDIDRD